MHLVDGPGSAPDNMFRYPDRVRGIPKTIATVAWLNALQLEKKAAIESAGLTLVKADNTQLAQALAIVAGLRSSGRNLLINGDFRFWQRDNATVGVFVGVTAAAGRKYTCDRWAVRSDASTAGAGSATLTRMDFTPGQTAVPGEPTYFLRYVQSAASTIGAPTLDQRVEDVRMTAGRKVTLSGSVRATAALSIGASLIQNFGAGGSAANPSAVQTVNVTTTFAPFELEFDVDDVSGATIGDGSNLEVRLTLPNAATFTLELADLQLEFGASRSSFERLPDWIELARCQRYYEKSWAVDVPNGSSVQAGMVAGPSNGEVGQDGCPTMGVRFAVPKRATPTLVWYSLTGVINKLSWAGEAALLGTDNPEFTVTSTHDASETATGFPRASSVNVGGSGWRVLCGHWTADAEL